MRKITDFIVFWGIVALLLGFGWMLTWGDYSPAKAEEACALDAVADLTTLSDDELRTRMIDTYSLQEFHIEEKLRRLYERKDELERKLEIEI